MKSVAIIGVAITLPLAGIAGALPTNPAVNWTVSIDGGTTWSTTAVRNTPGAVLVRAQLSWSDSGSGAVGIGAALCSFDCTLSGVTASDNATSITKTLIPVADTQVLVYTYFGGGVGKIDVNTDTALAAVGPGWINTGQGTPQGIGPNFDSRNPITVLTYQFNISGIDHDVDLGSILNGTATQAVRVYLTAAGGTSGGGQFSRPAVPVYGARVSLITPAPGTFALTGLSGLIAIRRRR